MSDPVPSGIPAVAVSAPANSDDATKANIAAKPGPDPAMPAVFDRIDKPEIPGTCLSLRTLEDFEIRDRRDEEKMVGLEQIRCSNVIVFGKARKLEGGEGGKRPFEILTQSGDLVSVDKPPHPLKLSEVLDWTVSYTDPPSIWLVTLRAWYKLINPSQTYLRTFAPMQRRVAFAAVAADALRANWAVSLNDALALCAKNTLVVSGDLLDPRFRVVAASNSRDASERTRRDLEAVRVKAEGGGDGATEADEDKEGDAKNKPEVEAAAEVVPLAYTTRDVVEDGAFIAAQLESLRAAGALVAGTELTKPELIDGFKNVLELTKQKELADAKVARRNAQRAAQRLAQRERLAATRRGGGGGGDGGSRPPGTSHSRRPVPSGPRVSRTEAPPCAEPVVPASYNATPALIAETLALWDLTQVFGSFLRIPPCPWPRFARAFLAPAGETIPSDDLIVRDVCVALLRVGESGVAGAGAGAGENEAARFTRRSQTVAPKTTKATSNMEEPEDLLMLDWSERVGATLGVYTSGVAAEAVGVLGPGPPTWPSRAIKQGAAAAAAALGKREEGARVTHVLPPAERVALAVGLSCVACDSEEMGEVVKAKTESTRAAHNMGHLPLAPRRVKPAGGGALVSSKETPKPDWAETLLEWVRNSADRGCYLRHRAIATDESGRAYHILGGSAGCAMLFVQEATPEELTRRNAGAESDDEPNTFAEPKTEPKTETETEERNGAGDVLMKSEAEYTAPVVLKTLTKKEDPAARAARVAAEARACIKRGKRENDALASSDTLDEWPTRWGVFHVGPRLKELKEWLDDDLRNPRCVDERRLKSISALLMKTVGKPAVVSTKGPGGENEDVPMNTNSDAPSPTPIDAFDQFNLREDGYKHLDSVSGGHTKDPGAARNEAADALCSVVRFVLSGSTRFWERQPQWLHACLNLCAALPDEFGSGSFAAGDENVEGDRLANLVARILPPLEAMLRSSGATRVEWLERRDAWFTGLRGMENFDLRVPPKETMSVEEASNAVALASAQAAEAIAWSTSDAALATSQTLSVARSARLLATLCASLVPDPQRLTQTQFLAATPSATHVCVRTCAPGSFVALVRKGFKLTRERYLGAPEGWIPLKELRPVERAVVRGVAYRGAVPPPAEYPDMGGTPPCCWVLLELVDPAAMVPGKRRKGPFPFTSFRRLIAHTRLTLSFFTIRSGALPEDPGTARRLVAAPIFAGGEIADYIIAWDKYQHSFDRPWSKGARVQMLFEDLTTGADPNAYGALAMNILPDVDLPPHAARAEGVFGGGDGDGDDDETSDADMAKEEARVDDVDAQMQTPSTDVKTENAKQATPGDASDVKTETQPVLAKPEKVGILIGERGAEYWLGRVSKVKNGDDPWENTQVVFDSDPHGEEPMWVCPWEIDLAPVRYRDEPSTAVDGTADAANDDDETETRRNAEHLEKCEHGTNIAVRLGWPQATKAARDEFVTWREACSPHTRPARAPTFCGKELDLYKVLTEVMRSGGYELVTLEKNWKKIALSLGKDLATQTSASFALRTHYQRCLLEFETWLWANAGTLGPRPASFDAAVSSASASVVVSGAGNAAAALDVSVDETDVNRSLLEEDGDDDFADSEDDEKDGGKDRNSDEDEKMDDDEEPEEEPEGEEAFDPDANSDEDEDEDETSDDDFEIKPNAGSGRKRGRDDSDEEYE